MSTPSEHAANLTATPDGRAALSPDELARATADAMYAADACSRALGFELQEVRPGYARLRMTVRADFLNGHQICHGGLIFTLADSTFAFACNSYNINTVASGCSIEFLRPVQGGDVLTAEGRRADVERAHRHLRHSRNESRRRNRGDVSRQIGANQRHRNPDRKLIQQFARRPPQACRVRCNPF